MKPILQPLDQTSEHAVVRNTVCGARLNLRAGPALLSSVEVASLDLDWAFSANALFGDLDDNQHILFIGDFSGSGRSEMLFNYSGDGHWWLGKVSGTSLAWTLVATTGFGNLEDGAHASWQGDFAGLGRDQVLFYYRGDGNWWLGSVEQGSLQWRNVGNTAGFGNLLDGSHPIWIGDFTGAGTPQVLFYYRGDGNWWLGAIEQGALQWRNVGNTAGFGNLLDSSHRIWIDDFTGIGRREILFYYRGDGNWWLGAISRAGLQWTNVGNTAGFGNLLDGAHPLWTGNFTGTNRTDLLFNYTGDGNWWLGRFVGGSLTWNLAATTGFGNLLDGSHPTWIGRFGTSARTQILFYYNGDGNWWLGDMSGTTLRWTRVSNTLGFGNLLDGRHPLWQSDFGGEGRDSLLFHYANDGNWWHARLNGTTMQWSLAGNTRGFGDLLDGRHSIWLGRFGGAPTTDVLMYYNVDGNFFLGQFASTRVSLPRALEPGESVTVEQTIGGGPPDTSAGVTVSHNYATQDYDRQRTGWNFRETALKAGTIGSLHQLFTLPTDDQVYTQPLYVQGVNVAGFAQPRNVVYCATERNTVFAFDADSGAELLRRSLLPPGEQPVPSLEIYPLPIANIFPTIGITGTPVIDRATNSLWVVTKSKSATDTYHQRIHQLDLSSLGERPCSPNEIAAVSGTARFDALASNQRAGLLLSRGIIYVVFGSHGDQEPGIHRYYGWMVAFDARTLWPHASFNAAKVVGGEAGIWMSGQGPAADASGYVYFTTGNGLFDQVQENYSNAVMKVDQNLNLLDFFAPIDQADLNRLDMDLGSAGVLVLPDQSGFFPHLMITSGKQGYVYVINRDAMGGHGIVDAIVQKLELYPGHLSHEPGNPAGSDASQVGIFGGPAYFRGPAGQIVYMCGTGGEGQGQLVRYQLGSSQLSGRQQSARRFLSSGTPFVTSNGESSMDHLVWLLDRKNPLQLVVYDGNNLAQPLIEKDAGAWTNPRGTPFLLPTVINGRVYVPSSNGLTVFGL